MYGGAALPNPRVRPCITLTPCTPVPCPTTALGIPVHTMRRPPRPAAPALPLHPCPRPQPHAVGLLSASVAPGRGFLSLPSSGATQHPLACSCASPLHLPPAQRQQRSMPGWGTGAPGQAPADKAHPRPAHPGSAAPARREQAAAPSRWLQPLLNQPLLNEGKDVAAPPPQLGDSSE